MAGGVPSLTELTGSPEFQALPREVQQVALTQYQQRYARPAAAQAQISGIDQSEPDLDQEDQAAPAVPESPIVQSGEAAAPTPGVRRPTVRAPFSFEDVKKWPEWQKAAPDRKAKVAAIYYNAYEKPNGVAPEDSQTNPGAMERVAGGFKGMLGSFQKTAGVAFGSPEMVQAGEQNEAASAETSYKLPYASTGWEQVKNLGSLPFWKNAITHYLPQALPYVAAGVAAPLIASGVGAPAGVALVGAALTMGGIGVAQSFGDAHEEFLKAHPGDLDGATTYAWKQAGISGLIGAVASGAGLSGVAMTGAKRVATDLLLQAGTGVGAQAVSNVIARDVEPDRDLTQGLAQAGAVQLAMALPGIVRAVRTTKGAIIHQHGEAEDLHTGAGKSPVEGGILSQMRFDPSTGMELPDHDYRHIPEPPRINVDPASGWEIPAHAEAPVAGQELWQSEPWARAMRPAQVEPGIIDEAQRNWVAPEPQPTVAETPQEPQRHVPGAPVDPSTGQEIRPLFEIDPSTGMEVPAAGQGRIGYQEPPRVATTGPQSRAELPPEAQQPTPPPSEQRAGSVPNEGAAAPKGQPARRVPRETSETTAGIPDSEAPRILLNTLGPEDFETLVRNTVEKNHPDWKPEVKEAVIRNTLMDAAADVGDEAAKGREGPAPDETVARYIEAEAKGKRQSLGPRELGDLQVEALRFRAQEMLGKKGSAVEVANALTDGAAGEFDNASKVIRIAADAQDPNAVLDHEAMHAARATLLNPLENKLLEGKFREDGKWSQRVQHLLEREPGYENAVGQLGNVDERIAYGFQLYRQGKFKADTAIGRMFDTLANHFERFRNWIAGAGFQNADDVFGALSQGDLSRRGAGDVAGGSGAGVRDLAVQQSQGGRDQAGRDNGSAQSLGPRDPFRVRVKPSGTPDSTIGDAAERAAAAAESPDAPPDYTTGVNTSRTNLSSDAANRVMDAVAKEFPESIEKARGGTIPMAQILRRAQVLIDKGKITPESIIAERGRPAVNAYQAAARRIILENHLQWVSDHAGDVHGTDVDKAAFIGMFGQAAQIQARVTGSESEAGRSMAVLRNMDKVSQARGRAFSDLERDFRVGKFDVAALGDAIKDLRDPGKIAAFMQDVWKPKWWNYPMEVWINALLSNPQILVKKTLTDGIARGLQVPETWLAAGFGKLHEGERVLAGEAMAGYHGTVAATFDAFRAMKNAFQDDKSAFMEGEQRHAIPGKMGALVRMPGRSIEAINEYASFLAYRQKVQRLAYRQASSEGLGGVQFAARMNELVAHPPEPIAMEAMDTAKYLTFTNELGPTGKKLQALVNSNPLLKVVLPFVRTPINLLKFGGERSPLALAMPEFWGAMKEGGIARDTALARLSVGAAATVALGTLAANGYITGDGPSDPGAMAVRRLTGPTGGGRWQPRSALIGGKYYNLGTLEPIGMIAGAIASYTEISQYMSHEESDKVAVAILGATMKTIVSRTYLTGLADFISAMTDPERHGQSWISRMAGSAVPSVVAGFNRGYVDDQLRDARTVMDTVKSRIPGLSQALPPRFDLSGQPVTMGGALGPVLFSPFYTPGGHSEVIANELWNLQAKVPMPPGSINKNKLDGNQRAMFAQLTGNRLWDMLGSVMERPEWDSHSDDVKLAYIRRIHARAEGMARMEMKRAFPELMRTPKQQAQQAQAAGG